jgi:long-chain fatty acid transport protein
VKRTFIGSVIILLILSSTVYATNGTRLIGFGVKMNGRGGTGIGVFDSPSLLMTNPAGMSFMDGDAIGINAAVLGPATHFQNDLNNKDGDRNYFPLGGAGYVHCARGDSRLSWGAGVFTQGGMGADYQLHHALFKTSTGAFDPQTYHSYFGILQAGPGASYAITPKFAVGASAYLMYSMLEFEMPYSMAPTVMKGVVDPSNGMTFGDMFAAAPLSYSEVTSASNMSGLKAYGFGGKLGFAFKVNNRFSFGLNYTSPTKMTFKEGTAALNMDAQFHDASAKLIAAYMQMGLSADSAQHLVMARFAQLGINPALGMAASYDLQAELTNPQSLGIGCSIQATDKLNLAADIEWINWKNAFDKMTLTLKGGQNANINRLLGNSGDLTIDFPLNWKDAVMVRLGGEYALSAKALLRLGYAYGSNPIPTSTIFAIFPAIVEHHITVGATYDFTPRFAGHFAYEMALKKSLKSDADNVLANEYNNSTNELSGMLFSLGVSWKLN